MWSIAAASINSSVVLKQIYHLVEYYISYFTTLESKISSDVVIKKQK